MERCGQFLSLFRRPDVLKSSSGQEFNSYLKLSLFTLCKFLNNQEQQKAQSEIVCPYPHLHRFILSQLYYCQPYI